MNLNQLAAEIHKINVSKGFWDERRNFGMVIALIHSELSEVVEEYRKGYLLNQTYYQNDKPEGIPSEFADVIIRVLDACAAYDIDIDTIVTEKLEYNRTRSRMHGGKVA